MGPILVRVFSHCCTGILHSIRSENFPPLSIAVICVRGTQKWGQKTTSVWEGKQLPQDEGWNCEMRDKLLYPAWRMRSFWGGGREAFLRNFTSKKSKHSLYHVSVSAVAQAIPEWTSVFSRLRIFFLPHFLLSGREYWGKSSMTSLRQPADFHPGGEEWEECIDV